MPGRKLKVFLSSTAKDLTAFRKAVHARLAASPLFDCIRQEDFGAHSHPAVAVCEAQVLECDLFIGLIGMRRGWEPPDDSDRRSITEMEYDWAKTVAPRFMYVAPEDFPVPGNLRETKAQHQRHLAFRQRIMSELVVSQDGFASHDGFASPEALAILIVDRLTDHVLKGDLVERVRSHQPANDDALKHLPVAEQLLQLLQERGMLQTAKQGGLERDIILKLAKRITPDDTLDFDRAAKELENAVDIALDVIARGKRGSNEDDFVNDVLKTVAAHTQAGETERAVTTLDDALKELDTREVEQRETLKRSRLTLLRAGIEQDILRRDAASVAQRVQRTAEIEHPDDANASFVDLQKKRLEWHIEGRDRGINLSLEVAAEIARRSVRIASDADQRGGALNGLGNSLTVLGRRMNGPERLDEAVAAYREALEELTRERVPLDWAMTQNNLGNALANLGERESGTARLSEAVAAYRSALEEYTRERVPLDWAMTQNNLGNALTSLGERERGVARLDEAAAAYRNALEEYTRERTPFDWAMTQNNLGNVLGSIGGRGNGTVQLDQAVTAYRDALKECTRERAPIQWATTQNNLGSVLATLGERESGTARLDEAIEAYRAALSEWTRQSVPLDWAGATGNQGVALMHLADRRGDAEMAEMAVDQIEQALAVMRDSGHELFAKYCEAQLPQAHAIRDRLTRS